MYIQARRQLTKLGHAVAISVIVGFLYLAFRDTFLFTQEFWIFAAHSETLRTMCALFLALITFGTFYRVV